jgi:SAM-dependent methyltransferase
MNLERIRELLTQLPGHSLVHGGSHSGKLYQNYPWPPLDVLPAHRHDTQARLDWLMVHLGAIKGKRILDHGCANGAMSIGLALAGARVTGLSPDPIEVDVARLAAELVGAKVTFLPYFAEHPRYDCILCLSVWKWMVRNFSIETANAMLANLMKGSDTLIFESGLTDGGMDLGIGITKADIPDILRKHTGCEPELLGIEPREDGTEREVWRCQK